MDGQRFAIDLSAEHATSLRDALAEFVAGGRRTSGPGRRPGAGRRRQGRPSEVAAADVRAWAALNGISVSNRGRVPDDVVAQYKNAQGAPAADARARGRQAGPAQAPLTASRFRQTALPGTGIIGSAAPSAELRGSRA